MDSKESFSLGYHRFRFFKRRYLLSSIYCGVFTLGRIEWKKSVDIQLVRVREKKKTKQNQESSYTLNKHFVLTEYLLQPVKLILDFNPFIHFITIWRDFGLRKGGRKSDKRKSDRRRKSDSRRKSDRRRVEKLIVKKKEEKVHELIFTYKKSFLSASNKKWIGINWIQNWIIWLSRKQEGKQQRFITEFIHCHPVLINSQSTN